MSDTLTIPLKTKTDRNGDEFLVGSFDFPVLLDLSKVSFFVFYPVEGGTQAELMIRPRDQKDSRPRFNHTNDG